MDIADVVDSVSLIAGKIESWKAIKAETSSVIRLLYLEACKNLELLAVMIDTRDRDIKWNDPRMKFFIDNFETAIMEMVLFGNEKEDVYKKLSSRGRIENNPDIVGIKGKRIQKYENVLQAIRFIYIKIDLLRKLLKESGENDFLKKVKVVERMKNIETRLVLVKRILETLDENKCIA